MSGVDTPCIHWNGPRDKHGYGRISRSKYGTSLIHRLVYCEANGVTLESIAGLSVRHKCDNPPCISPKHLELGTHADNMRDRQERGRTRVGIGERHRSAKLTEEQVLEIRRVYVPRDAEYGARALGRKYGVEHSVISLICSRAIWTHI